MIYNRDIRELKTDGGKLLKKLDCPLRKEWDRLRILPEDASKRHCYSCNKAVFNLAGKSDEEAEQLFLQSPECCVYVAPNAKNIAVRGYKSEWPDPCPFRRIQTARGEDAINQAVKDGFWPLVKQVKRPQKFSFGIRVYQDENTGEVFETGDPRNFFPDSYKVVVKDISHNPYAFKHNIAAYLLPADLLVGERVFLVDLIEDLVEAWHNGLPSRLESAYAIWTGKDFKIQWNQLINPKHHHSIG